MAGKAALLVILEDRPCAGLRRISQELDFW